MSGMKDTRIVTTEVLPNMLAYILIVFVLLVGGAILAEAGISMIGLGPTNTTTLGQMLYWARTEPPVGASWWDAWWWFIPPGVMLAMFLSSILVMHTGMDEVFNPRLRRM
jgi:peptide/nickel transport system permease protein